MPPFFNHIRRLALLIMLMSLAVACSTPPRPVDQAPTESATAESPSVSTQVSTEAIATEAIGTQVVGTPDAPQTFGPGKFNLDPATGLTALGSYQATLKEGFKGKTGGKDSPWSETLTLRTDDKPSARVLTASFTGQSPATQFISPWSAQVSGVFYWQAADGGCIQSTIQQGTPDPNAPAVWEPASFLPGIIGADDKGTDTANGVSTEHYTFDERALGAAGRAKATGEIWVAAKGGYVVKYTLTLDGQADYFGEGGEGTLTWDYELSNVGKTATITLPQDCPPGLIDAPLMKDAQDVKQLPGATVYTTSSTIEQVADFYQKQFAGVGWKLDGDPNITDKQGLLTFKQGTSQLTVTIVTGDKGTSVHLLLN